MTKTKPPYRSSYFFGSTGSGPGERNLLMNADRFTNCTNIFRGVSAKNGGHGISPQDIQTVLQANGFPGATLHEVSAGTLKLRGYPVPAGGDGTKTWHQYFRYDSGYAGNAFTPIFFPDQYAVAGMICTAPATVGERKTLGEQLPFATRIRLLAHGRGQHLALWFFHYGGTSYSEIDIAEFVVDANNLTPGLFCSTGIHTGPEPGVPGFFDFRGNGYFIDRWMVFTMELVDSNLVIKRDGVTLLTFPAAPWLDQPMYYMMTYEGGGSAGQDPRKLGGAWAGAFLGDPVVRTQPADERTATPWPCGVEVDYIRLGTLNPIP